MANYVPFFRSNYFAVIDLAAFQQFCSKFKLECITHDTERFNRQALVGFLGHEEQGIPTDYYDEDIQDSVECNFMQELSRHLQPDHVAIVQEVGHQKLCYLVGYAIAVNHKGKTRQIDLTSIYDRARPLGSHITRCES